MISDQDLFPTTCGDRRGAPGRHSGNYAAGRRPRQGPAGGAAGGKPAAGEVSIYGEETRLFGVMFFILS